MTARRKTGPPTFTWREFYRGAAAAGALAAGAAVYGLVFGALAAQAGLTLVVAAVMSALVYAGGAQVAVLPIWAGPLPLLAIWATTLAVNARYFLLSAALRPWLAGGARGGTYGTLLMLSDGGWLLALRRWQNGAAAQGAAAGGAVDGGFLLGTGLVQYPLWLAGTIGGHVLGNEIGSPAAYGLDFVLPAFFAAIAAGMWRGRGDLAPALVAAVVALIALRVLPGHWSVLVAALAGSFVGMFTHAHKS